MVESNVSLLRCIVDVRLWMNRLGLPLRRAVHTAHKPLSSVRPSVRPSDRHAHIASVTRRTDNTATKLGEGRGRTERFTNSLKPN